MSPQRFRELSRTMFADIPAEFREGVAGLVVEREARPHPALPGIFTLGECVTDSWPDGLGGQGETQSHIVLYYGSFRALADDDPLFDWEAELWETLLHELLHHREAAASQDGLERFDWAMEQNFLRWAGHRFDSRFHLVLPRDEDGAVRLDGETFVDAVAPPGGGDASFRWRERTYSVRVPPGEDTVWVGVRNLAGGRLWVVARRRLPVWRRLFGPRQGSPLVVLRRALPARPT